MRIVGIVLLIAGILMMVFSGINFQTTKKVVDLGPIQVDKKEDKHVGWPVYTGAIAIIAGIVLVAVDSKKKTA